MSRTARRFSRTAPSARGLSGEGYDVGFFTGPNYTGQSLWLNHGDVTATLSGGLDNRFRSVLVQNPAKVFAYTGEGYNDAVLQATESVADFSARYYFGNTVWADKVSSYEIRPADYAWPTIATQATYTFANGKVIAPAPGSAAFSNCSVDTLTTDIQHQPNYDTFVAELAGADSKAVFEQVCRNLCSVLYDSPDQVPFRANNVLFSFLDYDSTYVAGHVGQFMNVYNNIGNQVRNAMMFAAAAFYVHKTNTTSQEATGTMTGIWYYPGVELGYSYNINRGPLDAGVNWYDGYTNTALFFDYVQNHAPTPSPRFVRDLNASFDARDTSVGNSTWNKSAITGINARSMTVEALWAEYKQWLVDIAGDVTFFSESNYNGESVAYSHGAALNTLPATYFNKLRSVRVNNPSKVYLFTEENQSGAILFTTSSVPYMFQRYYGYAPFMWYDDVESFRVRDPGWTWPQVASQSEVLFNGGAKTKVKSGSELYDVVTTRDDPQIVVEHTATYNAVKSIMPDSTIRAHFDQASRNACAILYDNPDEVDIRHYSVTSKYVDSETFAALAIKSRSEIWFAVSSTYYPAEFGQYFAHELVHMYQNIYSTYGTDVYITGVIEGIADYAIIIMSYITSSSRPSAGGVNWYDGYETTAFFFHYITHSAPIKSPNFVKDLNRQMDPRTHGTREWTPDLIAQINVQGKTVDQLWSDYKAWLA